MLSGDIVHDLRPAALTDPEVHAFLRAAGASTHGFAARNYALVQGDAAGIRRPSCGGSGQVTAAERSSVLLNDGEMTRVGVKGRTSNLRGFIALLAHSATFRRNFFEGGFCYGRPRVAAIALVSC